MTALPTRKLEAFRYADIDALASVWSELARPERIEIAAQQNVQQIWLPGADPVQVRRVEIALEAGARANIFALNTATIYGRIEIDVTLADGAHFGLDAANIGGGSATLEIVTTVRHIGVAATSRQTIDRRNGFVEFRVGEDWTYWLGGLSMRTRVSRLPART